MMMSLVLLSLVFCQQVSARFYSLQPENFLTKADAVASVLTQIGQISGDTAGECVDKSEFDSKACLCRNVRFDAGKVFQSAEFEDHVLRTLDLVHLFAPTCLDGDRFDLLDRVTQMACSAFQRPCTGGETSGLQVPKMCRSECLQLHEDYAEAFEKRGNEREEAINNLEPQIHNPANLFGPGRVGIAKTLCTAAPLFLLPCKDDTLFSDDEDTCVRTKPLSGPLREGLVECRIAHSEEQCDLGEHHRDDLMCTTPEGEQVPLLMQSKEMRVLFASPEDIVNYNLPISHVSQSLTNKHIRLGYELNMAGYGEYNWPTGANPPPEDFYFKSLQPFDMRGLACKYTCARVENGLPRLINVTATLPNGTLTLTFEQFEDDRIVESGNGLPSVFVAGGAIKTSLSFEGWVAPWRPTTNRIVLAMTLRFGPYAGLAPDIMMLPPPEQLAGERAYMLDAISPVEVPGVSLRFRQPLFYQIDDNKYNGLNDAEIVWPRWGFNNFDALLTHRACPKVPLEVDFDKFDRKLVYDPDFKFIVSPNSDRERYERSVGAADVNAANAEPESSSAGATAAIVIVVLLIVIGGGVGAFFVYRRRAALSDNERSGVQ